MKQLRAWLAWLAIVGATLAALAIPLGQYSQTASSNNQAVPDGAPEHWNGAQINEWARQWMAVVRAWYDDPQWLEITYDLTPRGTKTLTRVDADTIDVIGANATSYFSASRRIKIVGASTVTCYAVSSALNGGTNTRVEVGTSCSVPTSPTAIYVYFGADLRSGAFVAVGSGNGLDADTVDANHGTHLATGILSARISYTSASTVTIERGDKGSLIAEIDGTTYAGTSDLTVDITSADRENTAACGGSASEQASTWYYLYLAPSLVEHISSTAPVMTTGSKVGYHPGTCGGSTNWRAIGAVFNNASSNIQPFDFNPNTGLWTFRSIVSAFMKSPGFISQATYTTVSLSGNVPATARAVRLAVRIRDAEDVTWYYGHESLTGAVSTTPSTNFVETSLGGGSNNPGGAGYFDIAIDSTPTFAWGNVVTNLGGASGLGAVHSVDPIGWYDDLGLVH